jgi:hypothetical protein
VTVPLRFGDGYSTIARVFTFTGLADGHFLLDRRKRGGAA